MLASPSKEAEAEPDHFECVVLNVKARAPSFYTAAYRTYYVALTCCGRPGNARPSSNSTISHQTPTWTRAPDTNA